LILRALSTHKIKGSRKIGEGSDIYDGFNRGRAGSTPIKAIMGVMR